MRDQNKVCGSLIVRTKDLFWQSIAKVRAQAIDRLREKFYKNRDVRSYKSWRKTKHAYTGINSTFMENERCPLCHCADEKNHLMQ